MLNSETDDRFAGALVKARLRIGQIAAGDQNLFLDDIRRLRRRRTHQHFGVRRDPSLNRLIRRYGLINHAEIKLRGLAQQFLQPGRVLQARHLHQNAIGALALDQRLNGAEFVDAAFHDLDRLLNSLSNALRDGRLRNGEPDQAAASVSYFKAALAAGTEQTAERL